MAVICPGCGKPTAIEKERAKYNYVECGLPNIWLDGGVTEISCTSCGEKHIRIQREGRLLQVIALDLIVHKGRFTGPELRFLRGACGLSQEALAGLLGTRRATVAERESKDDPNLGRMESLGVRLMLLMSFQEFLDKDGNNLLAESHRNALKKFTLDYHLHVIETVDRKVPSRHFRHVRSSEDWQLPQAA